MQQRIFYVYELARPDGRVFYVGKGTGRRIRRHEIEARKSCQCHKCNVIRKIWREGGQVVYDIILETADEAAAFAGERERIAIRGRDNLVNRTDGGDGSCNPSLETRQRMMAAQQKRWISPEAHERQSRALTGKKLSQRTREKIRRANLKRYRDPVEREATSARLRGHKVEQTTREKISASVSRVWETPEHRDRVLPILRSEEYRRKASERAKRLWADPEKRAQMQAALKAARARREEKKRLQS